LQESIAYGGLHGGLVYLVIITLHQWLASDIIFSLMKVLQITPYMRRHDVLESDTTNTMFVQKKR
jgi:hypothetical protein